MNIVRSWPGRGAGAAFPLHSLVRLVDDLETPDGVVPKGTLATVLHVFDGGRAYQVEFEGEHDPPETVAALALVSAEDARLDRHRGE